MKPEEEPQGLEVGEGDAAAGEAPADNESDEGYCGSPPPPPDSDDEREPLPRGVDHFRFPLDVEERRAGLVHFRGCPCYQCVRCGNPHE